MWRSSAHDATKFGRLARRSVYMSWTKNSSSTVVIAYYNGACQAGVFYGQSVDWLCHLTSLWGSFYSWLNAHPVFCLTALIIITFGSVKFWNIFRFLIIIIIPGYKGATGHRPLRIRDAYLMGIGNFKYAHFCISLRKCRFLHHVLLTVLALYTKHFTG